MSLPNDIPLDVNDQIFHGLLAALNAEAMESHFGRPASELTIADLLPVFYSVTAMGPRPSTDELYAFLEGPEASIVDRIKRHWQDRIDAP
jgi:hypothetical protein